MNNKRNILIFCAALVVVFSIAFTLPSKPDLSGRIKANDLESLLSMTKEANGKVKVHGYKPGVPVEEPALNFAPNVPPPIERRVPAVVKVNLVSETKEMTVKPGVKYQFWTFNGHVPGPFIRARVGDVLEIHHRNTDASGKPHNVDFHSVTGTGGGAPVTTAMQGEEKVAWFKLIHPGFFVYHCAAPPVMDHIANGMYGMILVEPENGLPSVDHEYAVMQSEVYYDEPKEGTGLAVYSHQKGLDEQPSSVVFNGQFGSMMGDDSLKAKVGDKIRIFFGNGGPNKISSFHVIGEIFDRVYREGDLLSPPARSVQTTLVPAGGATVVEFDCETAGTYTMVDHAIFRVEKGAVGFINVAGDPRRDIYLSQDDAVPCKGCLVHP